jgi:hypothetical protein
MFQIESTNSWIQYVTTPRTPIAASKAAGILDYCNVDRERYTMLGQLCLVGILVVGAVKIFGRK